MRRPTNPRHSALAVALAALAAVTALFAPSAASAAPPPWEDHATSFSGTAGPTAQPRVVDLRYATHPGFDRVVIEIQGAIPPGTVRYQRRFTQDGSGAPVPIGGRSGIALALSPALAHDAEGHSVYDGPRVARPRFETLKALAFTGDSEGYVSFGFALTHRAPYRVFWLHQPQRLVIDFQHE